jgi:hypothetical protein
MPLFFDALWRAAAYCAHPRVIALSLVPLLLAGGAMAWLGWLFWEQTLDAVRALLERWALVDAMLRWIEVHVGIGARTLIVPLIVVTLVLPAAVLLTLLLVAWLMTPALVSLVLGRRFPGIAASQGATRAQCLLGSLGYTALALLALVVSLPLWLVPPLALVLPPLIWGWLVYHVMSFDVLARHASADERRSLLRRHRWPLWSIGITAGMLGTAPGLLWTLGWPALLPLAPIVVPLLVWVYTLVFAFAALWFAHYALAALAVLRSGENAQP